MKRLENWDIRLGEAVDDAKETVFSWGRHDCCTFAARCVEAITGKDPMATFRNKYHDQKSSLEILKQEGMGTLFLTLKSIFGDPVGPAKANRGDLVFVSGGNGPCLGVCLGRHSVFVGQDEGAEGLVFVPTKETHKVFKI